MLENGNEMIHFEEYDDKIDITSVVIPINKKYEKYKNLDIEGQNLDIEDVEVKINKVDFIGVINKSDYSYVIRKELVRIYDKFFNSIFSRSDIVSYLGISNSSGTNYINYLLELNIIESVSGQGKGKYKFK